MHFPLATAPPARESLAAFKTTAPEAPTSFPLAPTLDSELSAERATPTGSLFMPVVGRRDFGTGATAAASAIDTLQGAEPAALRRSPPGYCL